MIIFVLLMLMIKPQNKENKLTNLIETKQNKMQNVTITH